MNGAILRSLLVAAGALCALLAMLAVFDQSWEIAYAWLGCGLLADLVLPHLAPEPEPDDTAEPPAFDANNERRARSGITFLLSVFVPTLVMVQAGFLDGLFGVIVAALIVLSGAYRLAFHDWALEVPEYEGFPAAWAAISFTLHAFDATPMAAALVIGVALILSLGPMRWPHPVYSTRWTLLTRAVTLIWAVSAANVLWHGFPATGAAKTVLIVAGVYATALAFAGMMAVEPEPVPPTGVPDASTRRPPSPPAADS